MLLIEADKVAREHDVEIGFGYEIALFAVIALAICTLAVAMSEHGIWLKVLLVIGTLIGLACELAIRDLVSLVLHGLDGTQ